MAYTVDELNDAYIIETKELHGYILDTQKHFIDLPEMCIRDRFWLVLGTGKYNIS